MTNEHKDLPALPGPQFRHHGVAGKVDYFTANQMRAIRAESYDIGYSAALAARPEPAGAGVDGWIPDWKHASNEWADVACSALVWLRNVKEGISSPDVAITNTEKCIAHCREVVAKVQSAPQAQPVSDASESACKMCGDTPRIAAQRLMLKDRFANREPSPATADFDLPPACIEEPPTAPDAGARDAALEEATNQAIYKLIEEHFNYGTVYGEEAARYYAVGHEIAEFACAVLALNPAPAKPAQDLGRAEQNEDELTTLSNELLALKHSYLQLELKFGVTEHLLATLRATIDSQDSLIKHLTNAVDYHKKRAK